MPATVEQKSSPPLQKETRAGNYFVSNYPPYAFWKPEFVGEILAAMERPPRPGNPLGMYVHIPFCRKRCHFCYFKVYTDKDSAAIRHYIDAVLREFALYANKPFIGGRKPNFIYFGGGTPSYLSADQLRHLTDGMKALLPWDEAEEVTFECEPGTLTDHKLKAIRDLGVTRLSLGVENFDDHILEINGRAHHSKEIARAYGYAREIGFPQINIDLIAGMVEETDANWRECVRKTIELSPDSVTIYEMEIPFNTTIYKQMKAEGKLVAPVADWETKRGWVKYAFDELEKAGYHVGSAYTAVKTRSERLLFTATGCGQARICCLWAWRRLGTLAGRITRTSTISSRTWRAWTPVNCRSGARSRRRMRSASSGSLFCNSSSAMSAVPIFARNLGPN
jgi:oxygen-independent coproporphyrinogen-3 oxidase